MKYVIKVVEWFSVMANRRKVYILLGALGALLIGAGWLTPDEVDKWLKLIAPILLLGGSSLAAHNSKEEK